MEFPGGWYRTRFTDFRQAKAGAGRSAVYLKDINYRLGGFARAFNIEVRELIAQDVADYLEGLKLHSRSFNNHLSMLRTFFRFCQARGWLSKHADLLSRIERRSATGSEIEIFTPGELRSLLAAAPPHVATCLAVQAFAGVRTAELLRLTWHDMERRTWLHRDHGQAGKDSRPQTDTYPENLAAWLRVAPRNGTERLWTRSANRYFEGQRLAASRAGIGWKANALRHSFISYRVAQTRDIAAVALEAGNSPRMIFAHYRELCTESEAADWFGIVPATAEARNVLQMNG